MDSVKKLSKRNLFFKPTFKLSFLHPRYIGTWIGVFILFLIGLLPCSSRRKLSYVLANLVILFVKKPIHIARVNINTCFPELSNEQVENLVHKTTVNFLTEIFSQTQLLLCNNEKLTAKVTLEGSTLIKQSVDNGKPVIFVLPHVWGIDFAGLRLNSEIPMVSMAKPHKNPIYNWIAAKIRTGNGGKIYKREAGLRSIIVELKNKKSFLYLPDEDLGIKHSVFAPFFSTPKATLPVLARLAKATDATVIPINLTYCKLTNKFNVNLQTPLHFEPLITKEEEATALNKTVEDLIKLSPEQYMWFLRIFKTRPNGIKGFYSKNKNTQPID
ncbi:lauroyl-Kdo(2)-lipid IV(A) myristoyltransferase [Parashewanella hymeniacidonis]|uniref:LpxL/LpxP family acyltransferase n=1 Tax=Parashewanella hymeniacidonis TaxID=2807618 RepID=UPI001EF72BCE|nr:lauroyl-Kdo(2)-lipid IV(A) myristoyltransferase [Parashewanella hymeniacidonis]